MSETIKKQSALTFMYMELHALKTIFNSLPLPTREEADSMELSQIRSFTKKLVTFQCALDDVISSHRVMFEEELTFSLLPLRSAGISSKTEEL